MGAPEGVRDIALLLGREQARVVVESELEPGEEVPPSRSVAQLLEAVTNELATSARHVEAHARERIARGGALADLTLDCMRLRRGVSRLLERQSGPPAAARAIGAVH